MLGKLIKYEFKATARLLIPLYGALIGISIICKLFIGIDLDGANMDVLGGIPAMISMIVYGITITAMGVVTLIIIIQRFYKNLLCDEGYLMNTLPVKAWQNITSKIVVAFLWNIISGVVALLSIFILAYKPGIITDISSGINELYTLAYNEIGGSVYIIIIELIITCLVQAVSGIITIYAAISIGHLANKRKILCSFGAFLVIVIMRSTISSIVTSIVGSKIENYITSSVQMNQITASSIQSGIQFVLISTIIIAIAVSAGLFGASNYILKNKLNLE